MAVLWAKVIEQQSNSTHFGGSGQSTFGSVAMIDWEIRNEELLRLGFKICPRLEGLFMAAWNKFVAARSDGKSRRNTLDNISDNKFLTACFTLTLKHTPSSSPTNNRRSLKINSP